MMLLLGAEGEIRTRCLLRTMQALIRMSFIGLYFLHGVQVTILARTVLETGLRPNAPTACVGPGDSETPTSRVSDERSAKLSYGPMYSPGGYHIWRPCPFLRLRRRFQGQARRPGHQGKFFSCQALPDGFEPTASAVTGRRSGPD